MDTHTLKFLVGEYLELWKDFGIESLDFIEREAILQSMTDSTPTRSKTPTLDTLDDVKSWLGNCKRCQLHQGRENLVFGSGNPQAKLMFVGEGPGADEDQQGLPFVGRSGKLLTKIIEAMGYDRARDVYIANVVKCRPPGNRTPLPQETEQCSPFLKAQIDTIRPQIIVALGLPSAIALVGKATSMSNLRGRFHPLVWDEGVHIMPTYHPAYLLRNPAAKKLVWSDMKLVKSKLEALH